MIPKGAGNPPITMVWAPLAATSNQIITAMIKFKPSTKGPMPILNFMFSR